jgi:hypothetical protein
MISRAKLLERIEKLEGLINGRERRLFDVFYTKDAKGITRRIQALEEDKGPTLSVPVVDRDGNYTDDDNLYGREEQKLSFVEVCQALQDMCGIEITYQKADGVVIYEKEDD